MGEFGVHHFHLFFPEGQQYFSKVNRSTRRWVKKTLGILKAGLYNTYQFCLLLVGSLSLKNIEEDKITSSTLQKVIAKACNIEDIDDVYISEVTPNPDTGNLDVTYYIPGEAEKPNPFPLKVQEELNKLESPLKSATVKDALRGKL